MYNSRENMQYRYDHGLTQDRNRAYCGSQSVSRTDNCFVPSPFPDVTPIAMAYVPFQQSPEVYDEMTAFCQGTLFPELDKPFTGCRQ